MNDPRNPTRWTNREIEADSECYIRAQRAFRDDREAAEGQKRGADDELRWTEEYMRSGSRERDELQAELEPLRRGLGTPIL